MQTVGFEPTRSKAPELKSGSLDQLGQVCKMVVGNNCDLPRHHAHFVGRSVAMGVEPTSGH